MRQPEVKEGNPLSTDPRLKAIPKSPPKIQRTEPRDDAVIAEDRIVPSQTPDEARRNFRQQPDNMMVAEEPMTHAVEDLAEVDEPAVPLEDAIKNDIRSSGRFW